MKTMNLLETQGLQVQTVLTELDESFPVVNPTPTTSIEQVMYQAGQRSVVEWIQNRLE